MSLFSLPVSDLALISLWSDSMWPLLQRDGLQLQYLVVPFMWNYLFGISPFHYKGALKYFSLVSLSLADEVYLDSFVDGVPGSIQLRSTASRRRGSLLSTDSLARSVSSAQCRPLCSDIRVGVFVDSQEATSRKLGGKRAFTF